MPVSLRINGSTSPPNKLRSSKREYRSRRFLFFLHTVSQVACSAVKFQISQHNTQGFKFLRPAAGVTVISSLCRGAKIGQVCESAAHSNQESSLHAISVAMQRSHLDILPTSLLTQFRCFRNQPLRNEFTSTTPTVHCVLMGVLPGLLSNSRLYGVMGRNYFFDCCSSKF